MSLFKNVNVVSYHVKDWDKAKKFYIKTLEWPVCYEDDELGWCELGYDGQAHISVSRLDEGEGLPAQNGAPIVVFGVEDAIETTRRLREKGVKCDDVVDIPGVVCFGTFYDPEGNKLQFASSPTHQ